MSNIRGKPPKLIEFNGKCQSVIEWAKELGVSVPTLYWRLHKYPLEEALTCKKMHDGCGIKAQPITFKGKTQTRMVQRTRIWLFYVGKTFEKISLRRRGNDCRIPYRGGE